MAEKNKKTEKTVDETPVAETEAAADSATPVVDEGAPVASSEAPEPTVVDEPAVEPVVVDEVPPADEAMVAEPEQEAPVADAEPEPAADEPAAAAEPVVEPETIVEEPVAEVEPETDTDEPAAAEPVAEAPAAKAPAVEAPAAPAPQSGPKPKRKRVPRSLRPQRTRPKREKATERKPIVRLPKPEQELGRRQERQGTVVSDAMDKTIVVKVDTIGMHRRYKKVIRQSKKFHAHDEANQAKLGDVVRIVETRPLPKSKNWRLAEIVEVAK